MLTRRTYAGRAIGYAVKQAAGLRQRVRDRNHPTYAAPDAQVDTLLSYFRLPERGLLAAHRERLAGLAANYVEHRFDLLGSGWVQVRHGMACAGVEGFRYAGGRAVNPEARAKWLERRINRANLSESQRIWQLIGPDYIPIDWQLDFKSGYRWRESTWYLDIRYGHKPGVDIKVPWELARMQHLPQMAWACALAGDDPRAFAPAGRYAAEFRNQVLDFIACNPPRFGVNWRAAMEVAIRAANWAVAADLFRACGIVFDAQFEQVLARSLYEHGLHIEANLEWDPEVRGNHYLANIVGLLFIAAYLPRTPKTDEWLAFAAGELIGETGFQFAPEGTHREASTCYHALSAEMAAWAGALLTALPPGKQEAIGRTQLPPDYAQRLERMGEFLAHITKPDGHIAQFGDNDSGRFLRLDAAYVRRTPVHPAETGAPCWEQDHLDRRGLIAVIGALTGRDDLIGGAGEGWIEPAVMRAVRGADRTRVRSANKETAALDGNEERLRSLCAELRAKPGSHTYEFTSGGDLREALVCHRYPDFGLYILRSARLFLAIRCGRIWLVGNGGHAHHDQLSIELAIDGRNLILDPGTYLYTALKHRRRQYRDAGSHFAPQLEGHQAQGTGSGLFQMRERAGARCLYFGPAGFAGLHRAFGPAVYRAIEIVPGAVRIIDAAEGPARLRPLTPSCGWRCGWRESPPFSPAYGVVVGEDGPAR